MKNYNKRLKLANIHCHLFSKETQKTAIKDLSG
jgi:hypothetical protein